MAREARVLAGVPHDEHVTLADRMPAEEIRVRHLANVHAVRRLEEEPALVDQAHERQRRLAYLGREASEVVEAPFATGVEHAVAAESGKTRALFGPGGLASRDCAPWLLSRHVLL